MAHKKSPAPELSYDTKTVLVVLLLVTVYPVGILLMFIWMKWPVWLKILIAVPVALMLLAFFTLFAVVFAAIKGSGNSSMAQPSTTYSLKECIEQCSTVMSQGDCAVKCLDVDNDTSVMMTY